MGQLTMERKLHVLQGFCFRHLHNGGGNKQNMVEWWEGVTTWGTAILKTVYRHIYATKNSVRIVLEGLYRAR